MGARRVGVALTALALLALAWSPLGAEASRALMEGDGARLPRREGSLGVAPSADGWRRFARFSVEKIRRRSFQIPLHDAHPLR